MKKRTCQEIADFFGARVECGVRQLVVRGENPALPGAVVDREYVSDFVGGLAVSPTQTELPGAAIMRAFLKRQEEELAELEAKKKEAEAAELEEKSKYVQEEVQKAIDNAAPKRPSIYERAAEIRKSWDKTIAEKQGKKEDDAPAPKKKVFGGKWLGLAVNLNELRARPSQAIYRELGSPARATLVLSEEGEYIEYIPTEGNAGQRVNQTTFVLAFPQGMAAYLTDGHHAFVRYTDNGTALFEAVAEEDKNE